MYSRPSRRWNKSRRNCADTVKIIAYQLIMGNSKATLKKASPLCTGKYDILDRPTVSAHRAGDEEGLDLFHGNYSIYVLHCY